MFLQLLKFRGYNMNISDIIQKLGKAAVYFNHVISNALDDIAKDTQANAKASTLYKGNELRQSIKMIVNGQLARTVIADKDYASYVEFGNNQKGPYIYPVNAKCLHFKINGKDIFAKRVKAHSEIPFMRDSVKITINKIPSIIEKHLKGIL